MYRFLFSVPLTALLAMPACQDYPHYSSSHPASSLLAGIEFDVDHILTLAPGSDNWPVTWAQDDAQYTSWGDGGGFGGSNKRGRVSMGVARIEGPVENFTATNVWGGHAALAEAQFPGKSYGILAVDEVLWLWRTGDASNDSAFAVQALYFSRDNGMHWLPAGVNFHAADFRHSRPFFAPTFLQFGRGYQGSRDEYVYIYAPDVTREQWDVQLPGEISLLRAPRDALAMREAYEFFAGLDPHGQPLWSKDIDRRESVFSDPHGVMRTSVTYNAGLRRYLLITQQISRYRDTGHIGIYEAQQPWGPWYTVLFASPWELGLQNGEKSVFWNFSNKWSGPDGKQFALVYTGPGNDNFGVVKGHFLTRE